MPKVTENSYIPAGAPHIVGHDIVNDFQYYDRLPEELRLALQVFPGEFSSRAMLEMYNKVGLQNTLQLFNIQANAYFRMTAQEYQDKYKTPYPAAAAKSTLQPYGPSCPAPPRTKQVDSLKLRKAGWAPVPTFDEEGNY